MTEKKIQGRLLVRADTSENWSTTNPTLKKNELGFDSTAQKFKIGDGTTAWNSLGYIESGGESVIELDGTFDFVNDESNINFTEANFEQFINNKASAIKIEDKVLNPIYIQALGEDDFYVAYGCITYNQHYILSIEWLPNGESYVDTGGVGEVALTNGSNKFSGHNTFSNVIQMNRIKLPTTSNGTTYGYGTNGQILMSNGSSVYWGTPSGSGSSSYPVIDLDDSGSTLNEMPSGTTTQAKIDTIIQAGGFYYCDHHFAPLIVYFNTTSYLGLSSRADYAEEGYSDVYQIVIDKENLSFETFYRRDSLFDLNDDNVFTGINTFNDTVKINSTVKMKKVQLPTTSDGSTYGYGTNGQVLMSNGSSAYWGTPSGSGDSKVVLELSMTMGQEIVLTEAQADIFLNNNLDDIEIKIYDEDYGYYYSLKYSYTSDDGYNSFVMFDGGTLYYADYYVDGDEYFLYYDSFEPTAGLARTDNAHNTFTSSNTFNDDIQMKKVKLPTTSNGTTYGYGQSGQVLMSNGSSSYWGTPSGGSSSYPIIDLDDNGLALDDYPSGTTTQEKLNQIIQAGGFYYGDQYFAPLIVYYNGTDGVYLSSRTDYAEESYSDIYTMYIYKEDLSFETFYAIDYIVNQQRLVDTAYRSQTNIFTDKNTFNNDIQMKKVKLPTTSNGTTYGYGTNGQVLMSNGSSSYWGTPSECLNFAISGGTCEYIGVGAGYSYIKYAKIWVEELGVGEATISLISDGTAVQSYTFGGATIFIEIINNSFFIGESGVDVSGFVSVFSGIDEIEFDYSEGRSSQILKVSARLEYRDRV